MCQDVGISFKSFTTLSKEVVHKQMSTSLRLNSILFSVKNLLTLQRKVLLMLSSQEIVGKLLALGDVWSEEPAADMLLNLASMEMSLLRKQYH